MLYKREDIPNFTETDPMGGSGNLLLEKMSEAKALPGVATFARAILDPGSEVGYHVHSGDSEAYYFLSGEGEYNDNGVTYRVSAGDYSFTPDGEGHGIKNIGREKLEFIALIIKS